MTDTGKRPVSPRNGQPVPENGNKFTSETAREAAKKSNQVQKERRSIAAAFRKNMNQVFKDEKGNEMTGAEIIAKSIIKGANNGNAKMVEIALGLLGEKPAEIVNVNMPDPAIMEEIRRRMDGENP